MADQLDKNHWPKLLRKYFGKSLNKHSSTFLWDLILLAINVKPCLLFDYSCANHHNLQRMLQDFNEIVEYGNCLSVVTLGQDFFIADVARLINVLKNNLKSKKFRLVDVSGNLERPKFVDVDIEEQLKTHFANIVLQLEAQSQRLAFRYYIEVKEEWNLSTMFGFLLCYPVIYWFDLTVEHNCLSMEALRLHKAIITLPSIGNCRALPFWKVIRTVPYEIQDKVLYSFSCPEILLTADVLKCVNEWGKNIQQAVGTGFGGMATRIEKCTVVQPQVAL